MELFVSIILVSIIVAIIFSIIAVIFGVISIKIDNAFVNGCFHIFTGIGVVLFCSVSAASLALIAISFFE